MSVWAPNDRLRDTEQVHQAILKMQSSEGKQTKIKLRPPPGAPGPPCVCGGKTWLIESTRKVRKEFKGVVQKDSKGNILYTIEKVLDWGCVTCWKRVPVT